MLILADENLPGEAVEALRSRGHDVAWVRTAGPGSTDREVLSQAVAQSRILVTFDKDFGELAFREGLAAASGIVLLRFSSTSPAQVTRITVAALESRSDWAGQFSVVEEDRVRMTPLPAENQK